MASNTKIHVASESDSSDDDDDNKNKKNNRRRRKKKFKKGNVKGSGYNIGKTANEKGSRRRVELLQEKRAHGPGYCLACKTIPCTYENKTNL